MDEIWHHDVTAQNDIYNRHYPRFNASLYLSRPSTNQNPAAAKMSTGLVMGLALTGTGTLMGVLLIV